MKGRPLADRLDREIATRETYVKDGAAIYERSFRIIRAEADLARFAEPVEERTAVRIIHSCGMVEVAADIAFAPGACANSAIAHPNEPRHADSSSSAAYSLALAN